MALLRIKILRPGEEDQFLVPIPTIGPWTLARLNSIEARVEIGQLLERHGYSKRVLYPVGVAMAPKDELVDWEITFYEYRFRSTQGPTGVYQTYQCLGWDIQYQHVVPPSNGLNVPKQRYYGTA